MIKIFKLVKISIHAPTWGATLYDYSKISKLSDFNPRTHVGCDAPNFCALFHLLLFQSTHPRGVRPAFSHEKMKLFHISIHAPTWGATRSVARNRRFRGISIHAPTWGATRSVASNRRFRGISIHAPTWGATLSPLAATEVERFQSTHPRGVRHDSPDLLIR